MVVEPTVRRARVAVSWLFLTNAVLYANLVPRLPEVKETLSLSNGAFGGALAVTSVGALLVGPIAAMLVRRLGSARVASYGLVVLSAAVTAVAVADEWWGLAVAMFAIGATDSVVDVAQNAHGFRVQRRYRRSIVNAFHGTWSFGAVLGGVLGSSAAGLGLPLAAHLGVVAAVFSLVAIVGHRHLLRGSEDAERVTPVGSGAAASGGPWSTAVHPRGAVRGGAGLGRERTARRPVWLLAGLGVLAACGAVVEDAGASWGALFLRTEVGVGVATGGAAFVALQLAMMVGRLTGDRATDRVGERTVVRVGGVLIAVGMALALAAPGLPTTLVGFSLAGLGVATSVPTTMYAADELQGLPSGVGLTVVSWMLRVGFLVSPLIIGLVADAAGLRTALLIVVLAGAGVVVLAGILPRRRRAPRGRRRTTARSWVG